MTGNHEAALRYADEAAKLTVNPSPIYRINRAHAYLLTGRIAEAREIYLASKDRREELEDIREDFEAFAKLGLGLPQMDEIGAELGICSEACRFGGRDSGG